MGITRLNHAVLYVSDLFRSVAFYTRVLGFEPVDLTPDDFAGAAFLRAARSTNDHDLADGIEFEIVWLVPADRLDEQAVDARKRIGPLDLEPEKRRYGATTLGGVGISSPA